MKLIAFTLEGYRRFHERSSVKLHSDLTAFVGPNEAGKSSLLQALTHLNDDRGFERNELPRRSPMQPRLSWVFELEPEDRKLITTIDGANSIARVIITKDESGKRTWSFEPEEPSRSRDERIALSDEFQSALMELIEPLSDEVGTDLEMDLAGDILQADDEYDAEDITVLSDQVAALRLLSDLVSRHAETLGEDSASKIDSLNDQQASLEELAIEFEDLVSSEQSPHPGVLVRQALESQVPQIRLFQPEDRDLESEYDLTEHAANPPAALRHLADLAGLDLVALRDEVATGLRADVTTRRKAANKKLLEVFKSWNQEEIALQIEVQEALLIVQVTTPRDEGLSDFADRSEGMRWFASLLAFTYGSGDRPILLADEIETHLHYDAQADLVDVLSKQEVTSKVMYTTHSFGCLPHDLGNGVRVVEPDELGTSRLRNGFWERGAGFSPLLTSMGAAAMTFTPTRRAVIGEGAADAILLPTLFRQASGRQKLDFQIAPGLASVAAIDVPELQSEAGHVGYVMDGDKGGRDIEKLLLRSVEPERIVVLEDPETNDPLETEDLVDPAVYASAITDELRVWNQLKSNFTEADIPPSLRTKAVENWCSRRKISAPDKAAVAQRIVNAGTTQDIYFDRRRDLIVSVLERLDIALSASPRNAAMPL